MLTRLVLSIVVPLYAILESVHGHSRNDLTLVFMFPVIKKKNSTLNVKDTSGIKRVAAAIMAGRAETPTTIAKKG